MEQLHSIFNRTLEQLHSIFCIYLNVSFYLPSQYMLDIAKLTLVWMCENKESALSANSFKNTQVTINGHDLILSFFLVCQVIYKRWMIRYEVVYVSHPVLRTKPNA